MKKLVSGLLLLALSAPAWALKVKTLSDNTAELKGVTKMNIVFTYDNMKVGKFDNEADYIAKKKADYNEKESGRGNKWEKAWNSDKKGRFEPKFIALFEKNSTINIGNFSDAKYSILVNTIRTEPGYNVGVARKNAEVDVMITIKETQSGKVVSEYKMTGIPGRDSMGYDFDTGARIEEAYAKAGKESAQLIKKKTK